MKSSKYKLLLFVAALSLPATEAIVPGSASANDINQLQKNDTVTPIGILYPQASETRDLRPLDGIWNFRQSPLDPEYGYRHGWYEQDLSKTGDVIPMPVPSSYNDVGEEISLRDHVGLVWYDRRFYVPRWWGSDKQRVWLRFGSAHYAAQVWVNGKSVTYHEIGHLPFVAEITDVLQYNDSNLLTVVVDNTLFSDTVPQGALKDFVVGNIKVRQEQTYTFDFFNYAGIHRSVYLYSTPPVYIDDIVVNTDVQGLTGFIAYNVTSKGVGADNLLCLVQLFDRNGTLVISAQTCAGLLEIGNAHFWWPYLMHPEPGYLYTLKAILLNENGDIMDTYNQKVGIRTITISNTTIFLNEQPLYLRGFGMHEDSDMRGKGWDQVLWVKNFNLIKWTGANAFRTSHYPYAEEIYQMADEQGIMIIDECPGVDTDLFTDSLLKKHKQSLTELIKRDINHPSVIMWSVSNEPRSANKLADNYFAEIVRHVKTLDLSRPVTIALAQEYMYDKAGQHLDVICFNRYNGWYRNPGKLYSAAQSVYDEALGWHRKHNKPVIMTEYGADTIPGLHLYPEYVWSEEYQVALLSEHFKAFDQLRNAGFFAGELIWNFADFKTAQTVTRVGGNMKGVFTRAREPKASAHHLRSRYLALAAAAVGAPLIDTRPYVSEHTPVCHSEL